MNNSRLNLICVDDTPNSDLCVNWYFKNYHQQGDQVGLVHLYNLPSLSDMFNDNVQQNNEQDLKFQIDGVLNNAKDIKEKFRARCMDMNVTPRIFFENVTDSYGKIICAISDKAYSSLIVMSQDGPRVTGSKAGPDIQIATYVSSNSAAPVVMVPPASMPGAQDESREKLAAGKGLPGPMGAAPGGMGIPGAMPGVFNNAQSGPNNNPYAGTAILGNLAGAIGGGAGILGAGAPMGGPGPMRGGPGPNSRFNPMGRLDNGPPGPDRGGPIPDGIKGPPFVLYCYLGTRVEEGDLYNLFARYGRIQKVHPMADKGFGFVHFFEYHEAKSAVEALNNTVTPLSDKQIQVRFKTDNPNKKEGGK